MARVLVLAAALGVVALPSVATAEVCRAPAFQDAHEDEISEDLPRRDRLHRCLRSCEGGSDAVAGFCKRLRAHPAVLAACWGVVLGGEPMCKGFCYWYFTP